MVLDDNACWNVLQLHGRRCLVDFLTTGTRALEEVLYQVGFIEYRPWRKSFGEERRGIVECGMLDTHGRRCADEGEAGDEREKVHFFSDLQG